MPGTAFLILLVEDDATDAQLFTGLCADSHSEITVHHVSNGWEALKYLEQGAAGTPGGGRPDLILLDLNMPIMDGHVLLEAAKQRDRFRTIPMIALTSSERATDIQRSYRNFANGYLVKPSTFDDMKALLQIIISYWHGAVRLPHVGDLYRRRFSDSLGG